MSWLGEQFNSFTEKLTDFTKEVHEIKNQNEASSQEKLLQICKEKDEKINLMLEERESFERTIEELDQQHQEAIDELLSLKSNLMKENNQLKVQLALQKSDQPREISFNGDMKIDEENCHVSKSMRTDSLENYKNLLEILSSLRNCSGDNKLNDQISLLKNKKQLLMGQKSNTMQNNDCLIIKKLNYYLDFLELVSTNNQSVLPMIEDISSLIDLLVTDNEFLKENLNLCEGKMKCMKHKRFSNGETVDSNNETNINQKSETLDSCNQTDILCFKGLSVTQLESFCQTDLYFQMVSQCTQTEPFQCVSCLAFKSDKELINQLEVEIADMKQLNFSLQAENHKLNSKCEKCSILVQTNDDLMSNNRELKVQIQKVKLDNSNIQSSFREKEESFNLSLKTQLHILNDVRNQLTTKEKICSEKDKHNDHQEKELSRLKCEIIDIKSKLNILEKQDGENDVDTCDNNKIRQQSNLCPNCKSALIANVGQDQVPSDTDNEKIALKEKLKTFEFEKSKLLCVLSEKTQECSTLKAEVHKLTSIVASEKQALIKMQQDNCDLKSSTKNSSDPELTKEAVKKLSRLIQDKDFEIESLKQKNSTLTALIAETSSIPEQLQSLIDERENLARQVSKFEADRDRISSRYNRKDQECRQYTAELKKLNSLLASQSEKFDILQQNHYSVSQQYEEKQKSLINTQNEMIALKQRVTDLEQQQVDIKEKYSELLNKINSDAMIQMTKEELNSKIQEIDQLTRSNDEKDCLIQEKDCMIHDFTQQIKTLKMEFEQEDTVLSNLRKEIADVKDKLKSTEISIQQLHEERDVNEQRLNDKNSELALLKEMNDRLNMGIKEKEYVIQSMTEKIASLSQYINSEPSSSQDTDINRILADSEAMFSKAQDLCRERDEALLSLSQSQQESAALKNDVQKLKINDVHLKNELERLRKHLLEIEENYTMEALKSEEREKELRNQLLEVSRRAEISSSAVVDTNQRASIQIKSLQEQLRIIANQRDEALSQVSQLEDKVQKLSASVNNLQFVLEQIQRGSDKKLKEADRKWEEMLNNEKRFCEQLEKEVKAKMIQLEESSHALEAATRLSEQLDAKEEIICNLKNELSKIENKVRSSAQEIDSIRSNTEGKVDRVVMKSLVLGYFSTPPGQKSEVIRLLARVLDFNQEEMEKAGIIVQRNTGRSEQTGILSSIFRRWPSAASTNEPPSTYNKQKSFTTLFVQFLENESQPVIPMPLPAEKMAQELTQKSNRKLKSPSRGLDMSSSPLLLNIDSTFPSFAPVPAVEYTKSPAPSILKEMLE